MKTEDQTPDSAKAGEVAKTLAMVPLPPSAVRNQSLDENVVVLAQWLGAENLPLEVVRERLKTIGVRVPLQTLANWWQIGQERHMERLMLGQIAFGAEHYRKVVEYLAKYPPPEMEALMGLLRWIIFNKCAQLNPKPALAKLITSLLRTVMDWAQLQERVKMRELAYDKFRESVRTKLEAGLDDLADVVGGNAKAKKAYQEFRAIVTKSIQ